MKERAEEPESGADEVERDDDGELDPELVELELGDVLDLHGFQPRDVKSVLVDYLDAVWEAGRREVRIVHGKGIGVQRETVRALLGRDPRVESFGDAPGDGGGWGATVVTLRRRE